jgi:hypothetical protein
MHAPAFLPANLVLVVDNAAGHGRAARIQEESRRRQQEACWLERYMAAMEDNDESDYEDDSDSDSEDEEEGCLTLSRWRESPTRVQQMPTGSCSHTPKCPERKRSVSGELDLSDDEKQTLLQIYNQSIAAKSAPAAAPKKSNPQLLKAMAAVRLDSKSPLQMTSCLG